MILLEILVWLSMLWAAGALTVQVVQARGGGRQDHSRRAGSPGRGLAYNFTVAMTPAHKESVRLHPGKFAVGLLLHVGVIVALLSVVLLLVSPGVGRSALMMTRPIAACALLAGCYLLVRRMFSPTLRAMSTPDDFIAIVASCGLLVLALLDPAASGPRMALLIYTTLLFVYLPLGKLRHAVFFFVARGDFGRRLGYRGVYPPAHARGE